ncbi:binding-protein-dependent transport systems inner membrane component [Rhodobacteraceae bacterium HTCC2150]|nr:binding-protein-dependent transport systems inner membrane component [Rhodobacteraceae bacterium HTCC2150]
MSCAQTFTDYAFRALGYGERALPKADISLCEQIVLIGSGLIWNVYFAVVALGFGFFFASLVAFGRASDRKWLSLPAATFIFLVRGSPLFIQFFIVYETFVLLPKVGWDINLGFIEIGIETRWLTRAWLGAAIVLFLNTSAYTAQIFYGALKSVPRGDIEAARAIGMNTVQINRRIIWPTMLRLAWPSYTNEAIFLFHATALVFFSSFPAWQQRGDSLYYASYFADKTFNPFVPYPIIAGFFILFTILLILLFGWANKRLNRHLS